jgi:hypothetical protein
MSQFNTVRSAKAASDLDARLRRHKLLEKGSAFVDRPEGGWRRPIPRSRVHLLAARVHDLGPRPLAELFLELLAGADPVERIEVYAALPADFIRALGGDRLPASARRVS